MLANQKIDQEIMITIIYVIIDTICKSLIKTPKQEQKLTDAEVITIAICSALYFQSEHKKALYWLEKAGYFPRMISLSRFNRRIHALDIIIEYCMEKLTDLFIHEETYIQDSMPIPVCKRARASRNKKVHGREFCGYCAAKKEKFYGFRLHMISTLEGIPASIEILPASYHDITCMYEITLPLPEKSKILEDKGYNSATIEKSLADFGIYMMPKRKKNQKKQWPLWEEQFINKNPHQIETSFSLLSEVMGAERIKSRTLSGFFLKIYSAVIALILHITFVISH